MKNLLPWYITHHIFYKCSFYHIFMKHFSVNLYNIWDYSHPTAFCSKWMPWKCFKRNNEDKKPQKLKGRPAVSWSTLAWRLSFFSRRLRPLTINNQTNSNSFNNLGRQQSKKSYAGLRGSYVQHKSCNEMYAVHFSVSNFSSHLNFLLKTSAVAFSGHRLRFFVLFKVET